MDSGTVAVRVRHQDETESVGTFTEWPVETLDHLVSLMNKWGNCESDASACGQFAHDGPTWFFEIIVGDD